MNETINTERFTIGRKFFLYENLRIAIMIRQIGNTKNNIAVGLISAVRPRRKPEVIDRKICNFLRSKNQILKISQDNVNIEVKLKSIRYSVLCAAKAGDIAQKKVANKAVERDAIIRVKKYVEQSNIALKILLDSIADLYVEPNAKKIGDEIK